MKKLIALTLVLAPLSTFAQTITDDTSLVKKAVELGNTAITILIAFAIIYIIYGIVRFLIAGSGDPEKRKQGRDTILWGVVGLFVILSIWGLVAILKNSFNTQTRPPVDQFPSVGVKLP